MQINVKQILADDAAVKTYDRTQAEALLRTLHAEGLEWVIGEPYVRPNGKLNPFGRNLDNYHLWYPTVGVENRRGFVTSTPSITHDLTHYTKTAYKRR